MPESPGVTRDSMISERQKYHYNSELFHNFVQKEGYSLSPHSGQDICSRSPSINSEFVGICLEFAKHDIFAGKEVDDGAVFCGRRSSHPVSTLDFARTIITCCCYCYCSPYITYKDTIKLQRITDCLG